MDAKNTVPTKQEVEAALEKKRKEVRDRFEFAVGIAGDQFELLNDISIMLDKFISSCIPF